MSINNYLRANPAEWANVNCNVLTCNSLNVDSINIDSIETNTLRVNVSMDFPGLGEGAMVVNNVGNVVPIRLTASQSNGNVLITNRIANPSTVSTFWQIVGNVIQCDSYCQVDVIAGAGVPAFTFPVPITRNFNFSAASDIHGSGTSTDIGLTASGVNVIVAPVIGQERIQVSLPGAANATWILKFGYSYFTF